MSDRFQASESLRRRCRGAQSGADGEQHETQKCHLRVVHPVRGAAMRNAEPGVMRDATGDGRERKPESGRRS